MVGSRRNKKKHERGVSIPLVLAMVIFLTVATPAIISSFDWLKGFWLSHTYIAKVTVKGNQRVSSSDILDASRLRVGIDSICSLMPHVVEKRIRTRSRYLKRVLVRHRFAREKRAGLCGQITIEIEEREPTALISAGKSDGSFIVIDAQGFILETTRAGSRAAGVFPHENLPVILGVDKKALSGSSQGTFACPVLELALEALVITRSVAPELLNEISCIDARDPDNIVLLLQGKERASEVTVRLASNLIEEGLSNILPVIAKRRKENRGMKYMDARFSGTVYCGEETHYEERRWKSG